MLGGKDVQDGSDQLSKLSKLITVYTRELVEDNFFSPKSVQITDFKHCYNYIRLD